MAYFNDGTIKDKTDRKPYTIHLLNVDRGTVPVEVVVGGKIMRGTKNTIKYPIESEVFKTKEEARNYAKQRGLKEDEYKIGEWLY